MPNLHLQNITIKKLADRNLKDYYLIINQDNQEAFFCFEGMINKEGWQELEENWEGIKELEIEYNEVEQGLKVYRRVINLQVKAEEEGFVVF
jgi:hypothetical protein